MSFLSKTHKYRITSDTWQQEHDKMYKENNWYRAWHDTMTRELKLKDKLSNIASAIRIYLDGYYPLPEGCDKKDWEGYVLITENSIKHLMKEGEEAEKLVKGSPSGKKAGSPI